LNVGPSKKCPNRNDLHLHRMNEYGDPLLLIASITKYAPSYSYASRMPHLEGEELFKYHK
jgi:hypothetical protein